MDYGKTLNLPVTKFPMRASLNEREPVMQKKWEEMDVYNLLMEANSQKPLFVLHDGPPFANGDLHIGHGLNKSLKDIICRFKNMDGYKAPYIHGWDTHGLPIETQAIKKLGINRAKVSTVEFRDVCKEFALSHVENHKTQLRRIGALGDYDQSYITLKKEFEAEQIRIFGKMANKGFIYKGLKPVYWCPCCRTALAEAEIEYGQDKTNSIYVKFKVDGEFYGLQNVYFVIWTTTTWTLPGNMAVCLNASFEYSVVKCGDEHLIIASDLLESTAKACGLSDYQVVLKKKGEELENIKCRHPFLDRESRVIVGDHVTLEAGTGCVHTAPGHGVEDYQVCRNYDIEIIVPVDEKGVLNDLAGEFSGQYYAKSNKNIEEKLRELGLLLGIEEIVHQYPHCWRCNDPIVFRATEQWFASVEQFKEAAVEQINKVTWLPSWGQERITAMVRDRSDWCISRQRSWGVPIPIFVCTECNLPYITEQSIEKIADLFAQKGSNAWFQMETTELMPDGAKCECGSCSFKKETDIMDVWFDSGTSHASVVKNNPELKWPCDLYLEGSDQYRGWFQSSLLTSVAAFGEAPYQNVISHGFVVDAQGKKMSKSKGNGMSVVDVVKEYGADLLRLWSVSADFKSDVRISKDILKQLSEGYRKIRNTARFILGNLQGYQAEIPTDKLMELDRWALARLAVVTENVLTSYRTYEFHKIYHALHNFCVLDMSNFYLDIIKDRLYVEKSDSYERRSAQTALYTILDTMVRLIAPILPFTADEIWQYMPHTEKHDSRTVVLNDMPDVDKMNKEYRDEELLAKWDKLNRVRQEVAKALEIARENKIIGQSLNAKVEMYVEDSMREFLEKENLTTLFIVSDAELLPYQEKDCYKAEAIDNLRINVVTAPGEKCERCWNVSTTVGEDQEHGTLCKRCVDVVRSL